jgi:hypothetical protein
MDRDIKSRVGRGEVSFVPLDGREAIVVEIRPPMTN